MDYSKEKISLLNGQMIAVGINLGALAVTIFILYAEKKRLEKNPIITSRKKAIINVINQTILLILVVYFLYISYKNYKIAKKENDNVRNNFLSLIVSVIATIAACLSYYVTINQESNVSSNLTINVNPEI